MAFGGRQVRLMGSELTTTFPRWNPANEELEPPAGSVAAWHADALRAGRHDVAASIEREFERQIVGAELISARISQETARARDEFMAAVNAGSWDAAEAIEQRLPTWMRRQLQTESRQNDTDADADAKASVPRIHQWDMRDAYDTVSVDCDRSFGDASTGCTFPGGLADSQAVLTISAAARVSTRAAVASP